MAKTAADTTAAAPVVNPGAGGFKDADLRQLLGYILNLSTQGMQTNPETGAIDPYMQVGSAADVSNVNQGATDTALSSLYAAAGQQAPGLAASENAYSSLLRGELPGFAQSVANTAAQAAGNIYSGSSALYSGAAQRNTSRAAEQAVRENLTPYMQTLGSTMTNLYGTQAGAQQGMLGYAAGLAQPEYFNPSYVQNPFFLSPTQGFALDQSGETSWLSAITGGLSAGANLIGAF